MSSPTTVTAAAVRDRRRAERSSSRTWFAATVLTVLALFMGVVWLQPWNENGLIAKLMAAGSGEQKKSDEDGSASPIDQPTAGEEPGAEETAAPLADGGDATEETEALKPEADDSIAPDADGADVAEAGGGQPDLENEEPEAELGEASEGPALGDPNRRAKAHEAADAEAYKDENVEEASPPVKSPASTVALLSLELQQVSDRLFAVRGKIRELRGQVRDEQIVQLDEARSDLLAAVRDHQAERQALDAIDVEAETRGADELENEFLPRLTELGEQANVLEDMVAVLSSEVEAATEAARVDPDSEDARENEAAEKTAAEDDETSADELKPLTTLKRLASAGISDSCPTPTGEIVVQRIPVETYYYAPAEVPSWAAEYGAIPSFATAAPYSTLRTPIEYWPARSMEYWPLP